MYIKIPWNGRNVAHRRKCYSRTMRHFNLNPEGETLVDLHANIPAHATMCDWNEEIYQSTQGILLFSFRNVFHICPYEYGDYFDIYPVLAKNKVYKMYYWV